MKVSFLFYGGYNGSTMLTFIHIPIKLIFIPVNNENIFSNKYLMSREHRKLCSFPHLCGSFLAFVGSGENVEGG